MSETTTNRYLEGPFAPVDVEVTAFDLEVTGTLPPELDGRYLRNGPNPFAPPDPATYHWFTGQGMVHGVRLRDGRAEWYRNRWVRSTEVSRGLGEPPVPGERFGGFEGANTNVIGHAGRTFAIVEAGGRPIELTDELDTVCFSDFSGTLPHGFSAHPKRDPATGELHTVSYYWGRPEVLEYTVVGTDGLVRHRVDVPVPGNPMVHDCSITERFVALYDLPVTFDLDAAMGGDGFPYRWDDDYGARIGLIPKGGEPDEVDWYEVEPCYVFHPMNAHDDGDTVVLDVVRHPRMFATDRQGPNEGQPTLWRWTIDRAAGKVREEQLDDFPLEFPRVDERLVGRPHRYGWAAGLGHPEADLLPPSPDVAWDTGSLVRYDAQTGKREIARFGPGRAAGELVFVPRSPDAAEDDGWYLTFVYDRLSDRSELVVLDARDLTEPPVARVRLPARVPLGFHGNWIPSSVG
ncbi:MAG: carotenoid oxygenase [Acidimicrobiales bacterium]|nr:carotenoid oxygenase [Acidimicrobiales bacterium]